ncbi:Cyclic pyranopterin monophosphate synthase, mitochondrial [Actinomortierella ambigua]|nr:Cyclic pyranopterin monophosphate synthase, mitochondrial [Actinomortierella ambigua]
MATAKNGAHEGFNSHSMQFISRAGSRRTRQQQQHHAPTHFLSGTRARAMTQPILMSTGTVLGSSIISSSRDMTRHPFSTTASPLFVAGSENNGDRHDKNSSSNNSSHSPAPRSSTSASASKAAKNSVTSDTDNAAAKTNAPPPPPPRLTHTDPETGRASMVSVTDKAITARTATATASIWLPALAFDLLKHNKHKKGDVLTVAQIAGIQAAKQTSNLIPLCHPLLLSHIAVDLTLKENTETKDGSDGEGEGGDGWVLIESRVACKGNTGVEMEALTAASVAALTVFDMCKAVGKDMVIGEIRVEEKTGGKSGHYRHGQQGADRRSHGI